MEQLTISKCACGCGTVLECLDKYGRLRRFVHGHNGAGRLHYDYKGGRYINDQGYVMILRPRHPRAASNGYVREHILVMEAYIGRPLKPNENIHHINRNRADNRIQNLKLMDKTEHLSFEMKRRWKENRYWRKSKT